MMKYKLVFLLCLLFVPCLVAQADYPENFDTYAPTTQSPGEWDFHTNNSTCYADAAVDPQVYNLGNPLSPPNDYLFSTDGNVAGHCNVGDTAFIQAWFNATSTSVTITAWVTNAIFATTPGAGVFHFYINETSYNGTSVFVSHQPTLLTGFVDASAINASYLQYSSTVPTVPGSNVSIGIGFLIPAGAGLPTASPAAWEVDDINVTGANLIVPTHTVNLLDSLTRLQFNIAHYSGSSFMVTYSSTKTCMSGWGQSAPNQCTLSNLRTSYINVSLTGATLLTVNIGGYYTRTLIPPSTSHVNMLLDNATYVYHYTIKVSDIGQTFGKGSYIYIKNANATLTSGTLDQASSFSAPLRPGSYIVSLVKGARSFTSNLSLGTLVTTIEVQISKYTQAGEGGPTSTLGYSLYWACAGTSLTAQYFDNATRTSNLYVLLYNVTSTGAVLVYNTTAAGGPFGSTQVNFASIVKSGAYEVIFVPTLAIGQVRIGPVYATPTNPSCGIGGWKSILPTIPSFPTAIFGGNQFFSSTSFYAGLFALVSIILTAAVFGARHASIALFVVAVEVYFYFQALFIPLPGNATYAPALGYTFIALGMLSFLIYRRRRMTPA